MAKPFRWGGYEIDRKYLREVERQIRLYPARKARLAILKAKYANRDPADYYPYRSPNWDGMPGAPGKVSDPTGNRVVELEETQNLAYLEAWVAAMDMVLETRLDSLQRRIIEQYVMVPPRKRNKTLLAVVGEEGVTQTQAYYWMNAALMEFAFVLLDEKHIRKISEIQEAKPAV